MRFQQLLGLALGLLLSNGAATAQDTTSKELIPINIGGPSAGYFMTYVAADLGLYQKHGLEPNIRWFTSGAPLLAALKSGSIDQIVTGLAFVFALGQDIPLKIISWEVDNAQGEGLIATEGSGISNFKDLAKAKKIAATAGTCSQVSLKLMAKKASVDYDKLSVVNIAPPLFASAFASGAIDAAVGWAPWTMNLPAGVKVVSWDSEYGGVCPSINGLRPEYIAKYPSVPQKLLAVQAEAREMIAKNPQLAIDALQRQLQLSPAVAKEFYEKHCCSRLPTFEQQLDPQSPWSLVAPNGGLAAQALLASQMLYELGTIPTPLKPETVTAAIDPAPLREFLSKHRNAE
ncbi:MAG: taurine ABC transporter substrate-binding protein [Bradyrhizobium sp.]|uniref:ABC transporter substrate-binding protein n=1 Tax=Bradyrhizobium sp. TaxID=376 RepID=UPI00121F8962|nr:ABC transporter substrate-binding protein [Bradyrhizobium sp.]THD63400.1 MAG: taurine ABC transporter substrate-binding protein [Bradyrhizobium sp.]